MATNVQGRIGSTTDSERTPGREIETIVEEFSGDPVLVLEATAKAPVDASLTPRTKSSLAKKFAKTLGFHSHSKDSAAESSSLHKNPGSQQQGLQSSPDAKVQADRGVHFTDQTQSSGSLTGSSPSANLASVAGNMVDKQPATQPVSSSHAKYVSPFQSAQHQPSGALTEASAFYSPTSSFNSVGSGKTSMAMSASLDDDGSQMRKSRLAPGNPYSYSADLEQMKPKLGLLEQASTDERSTSGLLSGKSPRSSAISLKSMDGASDSDKDMSALARANSENPWGPKRSVGSFTSGVSGRARGDQSPRLRGAYAEIQIKDMDQQLSDARMRIVQLTTEVQSSKQAAQHHEERTAALQAQLEELKQMKDSSTQDILERLSSARSESSSLSEQLALAKRNAEAEHKENLKLQKAMSEQGTTQQRAVDAKQKELETQQATAQAAQDKLQEQIAQLTQQCNSYEVVLKNGDTKGQLMSLQQTLRQEIHAKIGAQTAEESAKRKVSDLQGHVQELQEALDKEVAAHKDSQSTLEEAYRHRNKLEARLDELEADGVTSDAAHHSVSKGSDQNIPDGGGNIEAVAARLKEVEARERAIKEQQARNEEDKGKEAKQQQVLRLKVEELEQELTEANKRLTRIDEADKRLVGTSTIKADASAKGASGLATQATPKPQAASNEPQAAPKEPQAAAKQPQDAPAKQITSWRRISVDDDRVDAVISHLEGVNTTLKSLRSQGGDLEPFLGSEQDLISELESERTNRVIAQQTANQERLQARASAAESASLRRQLNELSQQMEQEKKAAAAARLQAQQTESLQGEEDAKQETAARTYSMSSEGHAADKAALQGFTKTRDAASSPARPAIDQQPSKVDEEVQTRESGKSDASPASQQQSGVATPLEEGLDSTDPQPVQPAGHGMEKNYTDTIESLLSELWKERLARQKAELSATDAEDKLKAIVSSRSAEGRRGSKGDQQDQAKAMADLDASLMQRLDEDSATNHKLMESLKATQGSSQALQERVAGLEAALRRQDTAMDKLQAGAKRHMEASLRQGTTRKTLQQATQKEDKLRQNLSRVEAELTATRRLQRDQAAHAHSSNRQLGDELVEAQARLSQHTGRLTKETDRRRHLEALLDEGLQVQSQILLGLQEMVRYLQQAGHLEGQGGGMVTLTPKLDQLISLLQQLQANSSNAMSRSGIRQGLGRQQSSPSRIRSAPSQKGHFSLSGTLEEGTPPVELSTSPPGTATFSRPAWLVPGSRTEQRAAARKEGQRRSSSPFETTAARYMNPRAIAKPATEPDRMFRARSVPRGMSPQRSRIADYIRVGSPVHRVSSTQVMPATSSDIMSRDPEFISAQHDPTLSSSSRQVSGNSHSMARAKPASLLSLDNGSAAGKLGSFSSYDKVQALSSVASTAQGQHLDSSEAGGWGSQSMMSAVDGSQMLTGMQGTAGRHTHED